MRKVIAIAGVAGLLNVGAAAAATVRVPAVDVPAMVRASDLILVGRAADVHIDPEGKSESFVLRVDRIVAGAAPALGRVAVRLTLPRPGSVLGTVEPGQYGLFFLHATSDGIYTAANSYRPALPAAPARTGNASPAADAITGVTRELARVLTASPSDLIGSKDAESTHELYWLATSALQTVPSQISGPELQAIADSNRMPAKLWAIGALLAASDDSDIAARVPALLQSAAPALRNPTPDAEAAVARLATSVQAKVHTPGAVPTLASLLNSSAMPVRRAAASALASIGTPQIVAPLAKTALNDPERDVRYYAVRGLAQATGAEVPTLPAFYTKEAEMLAHWRSWAKTDAAAIKAPPANDCPANNCGACSFSGNVPVATPAGESVTLRGGGLACNTHGKTETADVEFTGLPAGVTWTKHVPVYEAVDYYSDVFTFSTQPNSPHGTYKAQMHAVSPSCPGGYFDNGAGTGMLCFWYIRITGPAPTISCAPSSQVCLKDHGLWWFNQTNPTKDQPSNYLTTLQATVKGGAKKYAWTITEGDKYAQFENGQSTISGAADTVKVYPLGNGSGQGDPGNIGLAPIVTITVSADDGSPSEGFQLNVTKPYKVQLVKSTDVGFEIPGLLPTYLSYLHYMVLNVKGVVLPDTIDAGELHLEGDQGVADETEQGWQMDFGVKSGGGDPANLVLFIEGPLAKRAHKPTPLPTPPCKPFRCAQKVIHQCTVLEIGPLDESGNGGVQVATMAAQEYVDHGRLCNFVSPSASDVVGQGVPTCPGKGATSCPSD